MNQNEVIAALSELMDSLKYSPESFGFGSEGNPKQVASSSALMLISQVKRENKFRSSDFLKTFWKRIVEQKADPVVEAWLRKNARGVVTFFINEGH
jgi:hypothetical protein